MYGFCWIDANKMCGTDGLSIFVILTPYGMNGAKTLSEFSGALSCTTKKNRIILRRYKEKFTQATLFTLDLNVMILHTLESITWNTNLSKI